MSSDDAQLLKGVLPVLVLGLLAVEESYGYDLVVRLQDAGLDQIASGTVYPVLNRLEREGLLEARLQPSPAGPARKYYRPTKAGESAYADGLIAWARVADVVTTIKAAREEHHEQASDVR